VAVLLGGHWCSQRISAKRVYNQGSVRDQPGGF